MDYQKIIDKMDVDEFCIIGKLFQSSLLFEMLHTNATEAVRLFSNDNEEEHAPFLMVVQEALDNIDLLEDALTDTKNILCWMRQQRSEIFNDNEDEDQE